MNASFQLEVAQPDLVRAAIAPSFRDSDRVTFEIGGDETVDVTVETDSLGTLRGVSNTVLMLSKLSEKILED